MTNRYLYAQAMSTSLATILYAYAILHHELQYCIRTLCNIISHGTVLYRYKLTVLVRLRTKVREERELPVTGI
jgi:hypothetical protein